MSGALAEVSANHVDSLSRSSASFNRNVFSQLMSQNINRVFALCTYKNVATTEARKYVGVNKLWELSLLLINRIILVILVVFTC